MVVFLFFGFFFLQHYCTFLFEFVVKTGLLAPYLDQLFEMQLLLRVYFDLEFINELLKLVSLLTGELGLLWHLLELIKNSGFSFLFFLLQVVNVAAKVAILILKFLGLLFHLLLQTSQVGTGLLSREFENLVDVRRVSHSDHFLLQLTFSQWFLSRSILSIFILK